MVNPGTPITLADLTTLATLANSKLSPVAPYIFPAFSGKNEIGLPPDISPIATYGSGSWNDGEKVTLWLYGYKNISGTKTYTWTPLVKAFYAVSGSGNYSLTWTWISVTGATAPDGYIAVIPQFQSPGWWYLWKDIGNVQTLTDDGTFSGWNSDQTLQQNVSGSDDLPCGHGAWLKPLNTIHQDLFTSLDIFWGARVFDDTWLVSGPWCVSVATKCYLYLGTSIRKPAYKNLNFVYSESDSVDGNKLTREIDDVFNTTANTGANDFNWDSNGTINGRIILFSEPQGQNLSDWTIGTLPPGVTFTFDPLYNSNDFPHTIVTAFIFDCVNVSYMTGTPLTLTVTPLSGGSLYGGLINAVFTDSDLVTYPTTDTTAIHFAGPAAKSAALTSSLSPITFTDPTGVMTVRESHYRSFCDGVFVANTLPTLGIMPYLDQDLPQYNPQPLGILGLAASSRRQPISDTLSPAIPHVDNRGALWPIFRDTDFTPDSVFGQAFNGSKAWQAIIATKLVEPATVADVVPPSGISETLFIIATPQVPLNAADLRFLNEDSSMTIYLKFGEFPTVSDFDVMAASGTWQSLAVLLPGFPTDGQWFIGLLNPSSDSLNTVFKTVVIEDGTVPNGTFFPTILDDDNNRVPQTEGYSYHPSDNDVDLRPIPLLGYCVYSLTIARQPVDNGSGVLLDPSTGTSALNVNVGVMQGFGWETSGTFQNIQTITIPAGQSSITTDVFLPVLSGTPLAYQCAEQVRIRPSVNFQPMMHSQFLDGLYNGQAWFNDLFALLFFIGGNSGVPILLPVASVVYNDLTSTLNLLP